MTITLNERVLLDAPLEQWQYKAPETLKEHFKEGAKSQPWVKPVMVVLADAALAGQSVAIHVLTREDGCFDMQVR